MTQRHLLILDGYNVIHAFPDLRNRMNKSLESARGGLNTMLSQWRGRHPAWEVLIVYDGQSNRGGQSGSGREGARGVKIIFTASAVEADERIKQAIREHGSPTETVIITRDREILACCRDHGVRFEKPEFLIKKNDNKPARLSGHVDPDCFKEKKGISNWYKDALRNKGTI